MSLSIYSYNTIRKAWLTPRSAWFKYSLISNDVKQIKKRRINYLIRLVIWIL